MRFMLSIDDRALLRHYQSDPTLTMPELAGRLGMTVAKLTRRLDQLRADGVILGQRWDVDWRALGFTVAVSLRVSLDKTNPRAFDDFLQAARDVPQVIDIQTFLGRVDVRLHVMAKDLNDYHRIYRERILDLPHIAEVEALMDVSNVKSNRDLPL